ncbi:cingulin [Microplitis demolitor]|uniref:cingulin n=1 Tax=Microplitis demolitor TaxID=69319 RepID=UPI0004CDA409|nr:cingulin [Microplitis demolitor]
MSAVEDNNINFQNLELKLREKFAQLQFKEEELNKCQAQLTENENIICKLQINLENERRNSEQLRVELKSTMEIITQLENEKIRGQTELMHLQMNWENAQIGRENLIDQVKKNKIENVRLQRANKILEAELAEQKIVNKLIEKSLTDVSQQINNLCPTIYSNVESLKKEQECLRKSFKAITQLNYRIDNMGHKILDKSKHDNKELVELREKLSQLQIMLASYLPRASNPPNIKACHGLRELTEKLEDNKKMDKKLDELCKKLEHMESTISD